MIFESTVIHARRRPRTLACVLPLLAFLTTSCSQRASAQTTTTLVPTAYVTTSGSTGGQPVSNLDTLQESGTGNNWNDYVEFDQQYDGYQVFALPGTVAPSQVTGIQVKVNYQGPSTATQTWTWQLYNWATSSYVSIGTNAGAPSWGAWKVLTFGATGTAANYVRASDGQIRVRLFSNNAADNADIDYEAVAITYQAAVATFQVTTTSLPAGTVGTAYSAVVAANGGTTPYTWSIVSGNLPSGVSLNASTGTLSGTPAAAGTFSFTIQGKDSGNPAQSASANLNISIDSSTGQAYFVSPGGSDTNAGTQASPWRSITHAINTVGGPGVTINVLAGNYPERVVINKSGSAAGGNLIIQNYNYPSGVATIDGSNVTVGNDGTYAYGLVDIQNQSYVTFNGFEVTNFTVANDALTPAGIHIEGSGSNVQILNNYIHRIYNTGAATTHNGDCGGAEPEAFGIIAAGTNGNTSLSNLTISGNELTDLKTGCSESMTVNGNINGFTISHNKVHNTSNIGIGALGGEGVASGYSQYNGSPNDQVRNGEISDNLVYSIHSSSSGASGVYGLSCYCADGIYLDGSAENTVERNTVYDVDLGIEVTGEGAAQNTTNNIVRDNLFYSNTVVGISIGGQGTPGGSSNSTVLNNTLYGNGTNAAVALGEFAIGTKISGTSIFKNNIVYAGVSGRLVNAATTSGVNLDYNLYFAPGSSAKWIWNGTETSLSSYQLISGQDTNSLNADPQFVNLNATPPATLPNLQVQAGSPALGNGTTANLGVLVGPFDITGVTPRINTNDQAIDIGAYEQQ